MEIFINRAVKVTFLLAMAIAVMLIARNQWLWAEGFLVAVTWSLLNFWLSSEIMKIALLKEHKQKLFLMLLVKFPLLYLLGFYILITRLFPMGSLLVGLPLLWVVAGVLKLCPNLMPCRRNCQI